MSDTERRSRPWRRAIVFGVTAMILAAAGLVVALRGREPAPLSAAERAVVGKWSLVTAGEVTEFEFHPDRRYAAVVRYPANGVTFPIDGVEWELAGKVLTLTHPGEGTFRRGGWRTTGRITAVHPDRLSIVREDGNTIVVTRIDPAK